MKKTKFKEFCKERKLTAQRVAELIGCSKSTVHAYRCGARRPHWKTQKVIDRVFGIDSSKLFDEE